MLTIVIPTYERNYFLARKLHHLAEQGCAHRILVLDSSRSETAEKNAATVAASRPLTIDYQRFGTEVHFAKKVGIGLEAVQTPRMMISFDDDFVNLNAVARALGALTDQPTFVSANGVAASFARVSDPSFSVRRVPVPGKYMVFGDKKALVRIERYLVEKRARNPLFNVWRTDVMKSIYYPMAQAPWRKYSEILFNHAATYAGPTLLLDDLLEVRHIDYNKIAYRAHSVPGFRGSIEGEFSDPHFSKLFADMVDVCARLLVDHGEAGEAEAKAIVTRNFLRARTRNQPLTYGPPNLCDKLAGTAAARMLRRARRGAKLLANLRSPTRVRLIQRLISLHGRTAVLDMLRTDPELRLNYFSVMLTLSPDHDFIAGIYRTLTDHPEPADA